jgi:HPt (histidine-containing phosphotransfer) domain-containing protein
MTESGEHILDTAVLEAVARDAGSDAMPALIDAFARDSSRREERLSAAVESRDFNMIEQEAHALVSSARTFGATALADIARSAEMACEEQRFDTAISRAIKLLDLAVAARGALAAERDRYAMSSGDEG